MVVKYKLINMIMIQIMDKPHSSYRQSNKVKILTKKNKHHGEILLLRVPNLVIEKHHIIDHL